MVDENTYYQFTQPQALILTGSGKPIFGLGRGIYVLHDTANYLGNYNCLGDTGEYLTPALPTHDVWHAPNELGTISADIKILTSEMGITYFNSHGTVQAGLEWLGYKVGSTGYVSLAFEQVKYVFWGFRVSPANFTQDGQDLFINAIEYALTGDK